MMITRSLSSWHSRSSAWLASISNASTTWGRSLADGIHTSTITIQAGRPKKRLLFGHLFLNTTNVFCAPKQVGHACICPRMVTG